MSTQSKISTQSQVSESITIDGISDLGIYRYFEMLNAEDYSSAAALFTTDGALLPPFEEPVVGREAIAHYLATEAAGMRLHPSQGTLERLEDGNTQYHITGKVQTSMFGVNVAWFFIFNPQSDIVSVRVKLLAAPQELLNIRR
ncbi:MAG TPA: ketosteroid isomerase family protein [Elainellaceae cyanobacterium]